MIKSQNDKQYKQHRIVLKLFCIAALLVCIGFALYASSYYHAGEDAVQAMGAVDGISVVRSDKDTIVFFPSEPEAGLIFYPGGKVEYTAYSPLMRACAEQGILCVLVKMPCNLAVLDINAADGITQQYPEVEKWYIGGHSLGGAMAAAYAAEHSSDLDGLLLLAAYSTKDLGESELKVLSVYGTEDHVLNLEKYEEYRTNLPADTVEVVIDGGCHAGFGDYGPQKGDGTPMITHKEQIVRTAEEIAEVFLKAAG